MSELEKTFNCGQVKATISAYSNEKNGEVVKRHSVKIEKYYKKEGKRVSTSSFFIQDLPKVSIVAQEAYKYLSIKQEEIQNNVHSENGGES